MKNKEANQGTYDTENRRQALRPGVPHGDIWKRAEHRLIWRSLVGGQYSTKSNRLKSTNCSNFDRCDTVVYGSFIRLSDRLANIEYIPIISWPKIIGMNVFDLHFGRVVVSWLLRTGVVNISITIVIHDVLKFIDRACFLISAATYQFSEEFYFVWGRYNKNI